MKWNPRHKPQPQVSQNGKTIRIDCPGYSLREEDLAWIRSMDGKVSTDTTGLTITYPAKKHAETAFGGMVHEGKCNVDSVEDMIFVSDDIRALAESLQGLTNDDF